MHEAWKQYEGQMIEGQFTLQECIGSTEHGGDFAVQLKGHSIEKGVLKLRRADQLDLTTAEMQLSLWRRATQLSHPNLLRVLQSGRCRIAHRDFLYVVMERAEENLSEILKERALAAEEVRELLPPVLEALVYLHRNGLVHQHLKPSNVVAKGARVLLSSDTSRPIGTARPEDRSADVYDAPETEGAAMSPASDIWSLGLTLVESLTQQAPLVHPKQDAEPVLPATIPQPFLDIAWHAMLFDPSRRWTTVDIAAHLKLSRTVAVAAGAAAPVVAPPAPPAPMVARREISPVNVPLSSERPIPAAKLPRAQSRPAMQRPSPKRIEQSAPPQELVLSGYVIPALAGVFLLVAIYALPKILRHRTETPPLAVSASASKVSTQTEPAAAAVKPEAATAKPVSRGASKNAVEKKPAQAPAMATAAAAALLPAPASLRTRTNAPANAADAADGGGARGEVLDQVLPDVSGKARDTIHGTIRVEVAVHVDPSGNVSGAEIQTPGPSRYFADLALKAAQRWQFGSPEVNGHSVPSEWLIRFEFSPTSTQTFPKQTAP